MDPEKRSPEVFNTTNIDPSTRKRTTPMQVLMLGMPRTATMSIMAGLEKLGLKSYHMMRVVQNPPDMKIWLEALRARRGERPPLSREEWDMVLGDYNVTMDYPSAAFMPELIATYPEAKVIIHQREFESWYASVEKARQIQMEDKLVIPLIFLDGFFWRPLIKMITGLIMQDFREKQPGKETYRRVHRDMHNKVRELVPADRLLEYKVAEGWKPLCEFLDCDIPQEPFPHINEMQDFAERAYWMRVVRYRRLWSEWSTTVYSAGTLCLAAGVATYLRDDSWGSHWVTSWSHL